jgi:6-pyruvoyltetrahydropterin/6-carboxytetrahydropterin synthase
MKTKLGVEFEIDFAHTLAGHPKCGQPHGHTSRIIVEVEGDVKKGDTYQDNMVIEFDEMKKTCWEVIRQLDHKDLNTMFSFPTSENITTWIFEKISKEIPVVAVKFYEGNNKYCEVTK